jgi:hypothetical protein
VTRSTGIPPREERLDPSGDLAALSAEVSRLARLISAMQGGEAAVSQGVRLLTSRLGNLEREDQASRGSGSRRPWPIRPAPVDSKNPTEEEIRDHILNQLYQTGCWNGKHTSGHYLARGYLDKVEHRRVEEVIKGLRSQGILLVHGKSPDEHFSLNPGQASWIYRRLGIPGREAGVSTRPLQARGASKPSERASDRGSSPEYVEVGRFENSVRSIRCAIEQDGRTLGHLSEQLEHSLRDSSVGSARLEGRLNDLERRLEVLERLMLAQRKGFTDHPGTSGEAGRTAEEAGQ